MGLLGWQRAITSSDLATITPASLPLQGLQSQLQTIVEASSRGEQRKYNRIVSKCLAKPWQERRRCQGKISAGVNLVKFHRLERMATSPALQSYLWLGFVMVTRKPAVKKPGIAALRVKPPPGSPGHEGDSSQDRIPGEGTGWHHREAQASLPKPLRNVSLCLGPGSRGQNHPTSFPTGENTSSREFSEFSTGLF